MLFIFNVPSSSSGAVHLGVPPALPVEDEEKFIACD